MATLNPDGSYAKTTFDPWRSDTWDTADTVLLDPRDDPDVRGYMGLYLAALGKQPGGWATWYVRRIGGELGPAAQRAAEQTAAHAGTPTRVWFDTLGQTFLSVVHNRVSVGARLTDQFCRTHSALDIQGNEREVRDALGRLVMRYGFAMLGGPVAHAAMDSRGGQDCPTSPGSRSMPETAGGSCCGLSMTPCAGRAYLRSRARHQRRGAAGAHRVRRVVAGLAGHEPAYPGRAAVTTAPESHQRGLRLQGEPAGSTRRLTIGFTDVAVDWSSDVPLEQREYLSATSYDALNRPVTLTTPDGSVLRPSYDPASLLERLDGQLREAPETTAFVQRIDYNARSQRTLVRYANGTATAYAYDPLTFQLDRLTTRRGADLLQDLRYGYDAVGNPTQVSDHAQQETFFRNHVVRPTARYVYDALYRLTEATGREHLGQAHAGRPEPSRRALPMRRGSACPSRGTGRRWPVTPSATPTTRWATCWRYDTAPQTRHTVAGPAPTATTSRACSNRTAPAIG